jgi:hypothetical protein
MRVHLPLLLMVMLAGLGAVTASEAANRPARKVIPAITAIDVGAGVDKLQERASLAWMSAQTLVFSGVKTSYADLCAVSGLSAAFTYSFDDASAAAPSLGRTEYGKCLVRGIEHFGRRVELFRWAESNTEEERLAAARMAWEFILGNIAQDRPVLCDYLDGGVIYGYDETQDDPVIYFSTFGPGFGALRQSWFTQAFRREVFDLGTIAGDDAGVTPREMLAAALANLVVAADLTGPHSAGAPAAMDAFACDLLDPARDWSAGAGWLEGTVGQQGEMRLCTAVYLRHNADELGDAARPLLTQAADEYELAAGCWRQQSAAVALTDGQEDGRPLPQRLADPGRREQMAGWVLEAIGHELKALGAVRKALAVAK